MTLWSRIAAVPVFGFMILVTPGSASAQASFGAYGVRVAETIGGEVAAQGIGVRAGISFPLLPLKAYAAAERIFPDCPDGGCSAWAAEAGLTLNVLPFPVVNPYLTAGVVRRRYDSGIGGQGTAVEGISAGIGVSAGLPGISFFLEGRYEFMEDPYDQFLIRFGVMF